MNKRVFVLGLDGATLALIDRKELPVFKRFLSESLHGELASRPAITAVAWPSIVSGVNAGKHNIFDFRRGKKLMFSTDKKAKELWDYLAPAVIINIPMTYPVRPIDGVMVADMMSPDLDSSMVYPEGERQFLKKIGYIIEPEISLESIKESIETRLKLVEHYLKYPWQLFFVVFREFDVVQHFFWGKELKYYQMVERLLEELMNDETISNILVVSDHGFAPVNKSFNLELFIKENGFADEVEVGGWGTVYNKLKVKSEKLKVINELYDSLSTYRFEGKRILDVYKREEIFWGPYAENGPEIVVSPKRELGFTFGMRTDNIIAKTKKTGCHLEAGVYALWGEGIKPGQRAAKIFDIFPTVLRILNIEPPRDLDGRTLI